MTFTNETKYNSPQEQDEYYEVSISDVSSHPFEDIQTKGEARGTIIDYDRTVYEDNKNTDNTYNVKLFNSSDEIFINGNDESATYGSITISGIPDDVILRNGSGTEITVDRNTDSVTLSATDYDLDAIKLFTVELPKDSSTDFRLSYEVSSDAGVTDTFDSNIKIRPWVDAPVTQGDESYVGVEDQKIDISGLIVDIGEKYSNPANSELPATSTDANTDADYDNEIINKVTLNLTTPNTEVTYYFTSKPGGVTKQSGETIEVPEDELSSLQIKAANNYSGELTFDMVTQAKDVDEDSGNDARYTATTDILTVTVSGSADVPMLSLRSVTGDEDSGRDVANPSDGNFDYANALALTIKTTASDESESVVVHISDIPDDAYILSADGTILNPKDSSGNYVSTIIVAQDELAGLKIIPPHDSNDDFVLKVQAESTDSDYIAGTGAIETNLGTELDLTVSLKGIADTPTAEITATGDEDNWINIDLGASLTEDRGDSSETLYGVLKGIPRDWDLNITGQDDLEGLTLAGYDAGTTSWTLSAELLAKVIDGSVDIQIKAPQDYSGAEKTLTFDAIASENDGDSAVTTVTTTVVVNPVIENYGDKNLTVNEDEWVALSLPLANQNDSDGSEHIVGNITLEIPAGIFIKYNGVSEYESIGSSLTLTQAQAATIEIKGSLHSNENSEMDGITFTRDIQDANGTPQSITTNIDVDLVGVADGWDVGSYDGFQVHDIPLETSTITIETSDDSSSISNIVFYFKNPSDDSISKIRVEGFPELDNIKLVDVTDFVNTTYGSYELVGYAVKAGNNATGYGVGGEGPFTEYNNSGATQTSDALFSTYTSLSDTNIVETSSSSVLGDNNETTPLNDIIIKNITVEDAADSNDNSETEYYIIQNNVNDNTAWSIKGGINAGGGTWIITGEALANAEVKIDNLAGGDGTLDLKITPVTKENDGDVKFDPAHPFTINYTVSGSGGGSGLDAPTLDITSDADDDADKDQISDGATGTEDMKITNIGLTAESNGTLSYTVTDVVKGTLVDMDGLYLLPDGTYVTTDVANIQVDPTAQYSGDVDVTVNVVATGSDGQETREDGHSVLIDVSPVVDAADITNMTHTEIDAGETISLSFIIGSADRDGSETLVGNVSITPNNDTGSVSNITTTKNANGTYTVTADYDPQNDYSHKDLKFDVTYKWDDGSAAEIDVANTLTVDMKSQVDDISASFDAVNSVDEGNQIALGLTLTQADSDGSEIASVVITGVPTDASLTKGILQDDGSWVVKGSDVATTFLVPEVNFSGDITISAVGYNYDIATGGITDSSSVSATQTLTINPVSDDVSVYAYGWEGKENEDIPVNLDIVMDDNDGSETLNITFTDVPDGSLFKNGAQEVASVGGTVTFIGLTLSEAHALTFNPLNNDGTLNMTASVTTVDGTAAELATAKEDTFSIVVEAVTGAPTILNTTVVNADELSSGTMPISFTITKVDSSESYVNNSISIVEDNNNGTLKNVSVVDNEDGTYSVTANYKPNAYNSDSDLNFTASFSWVDGTAAANTQTLNFATTINAVANEANLDLTDSVRGDVNIAIALDITSSLVDADGSESLSITIDTLGKGSLNNGTDNGDGTWTLTGAELSDLEITPNTQENFDITVTSTTAESSNNDTQSVSETISINAGANDETFTLANNDIDGFAGSDTLTISGNENIDFRNLTNTVENIEAVNLESGTHNITISLDNVLDMTDSNNSLDITAITDDSDAIEIDTAGWTGTSTDNGSETTYTYTKDGSIDSITLTVDDTIDQSVI